MPPPSILNWRGVAVGGYPRINFGFLTSNTLLISVNFKKLTSSTHYTKINVFNYESL